MSFKLSSFGWRKPSVLLLNPLGLAVSVERQALTSYECCKQTACRFLKMLLVWEHVQNPCWLLDLPVTSVGENQTVWSGSVSNIKVKLKTSNDTFFSPCTFELAVDLSDCSEGGSSTESWLWRNTFLERKEYVSVPPYSINISLNSAGIRASRAHFSWKKCCLSEPDISQLELDLFLRNQKSKHSSWLLKRNFFDVHPSFMLVT